MKVNTIQSYRYNNASNNQNRKNNTPAFKGLQFLYESDKKIMSQLSEEGKKVLKEAMDAKYNLKELCGYDNGLHRIGREVIDIILKIQKRKLNTESNDTIVYWFCGKLLCIAPRGAYGLIKDTGWLDREDSCFKKEDCYLDGKIYVPTKTAVENFLKSKIDENVKAHSEFEKFTGYHWLS